MIDLSKYIERFAASPLQPWAAMQPWEITIRSAEIVTEIVNGMEAGEFAISGGIAVHRTAIVEDGAVLKAPLILGPRCFVAAGAYLRGGNWIDADCIFGPGAELKSSFVFAGSKLAHFNFVGDSILGMNVNLEAGSIICNYRNERDDKEIRIESPEGLVSTGVNKFGALVGDGVRIGANAVVAPGALIAKGIVVTRTSLLDQGSK